MKIHILQHVIFEDDSYIGVWAEDNGHAVSHSRFYLGQDLPPVENFDWLVIMGGPMNVNEDEKYPWLPQEKELIKAAIDQNKHILGICLGAQLIAKVLGAEISVNEYKEIGWYPVRLTDAAKGDSLLSDFPDEMLAFHWHGDMFTIPEGAVHLATSEACPNQAFQYGDRVLGLQFHLDYSPQSIEEMILHCGNELVKSPYIQTHHQQLISDERTTDCRILLFQLLEKMAQLP